MQEDIENRTVTLAINGGKLSARALKAAIVKLLTHMKNQSYKKSQAHKDVKPCGKQTVKQLIGQNQGVSNVELDNPAIREFDRIAKKYGVDYAVKKVKGDKPKYLIFFKAKDADAITAALQEYAKNRMDKEKRPSIRKLLQSLRDLVANRDPTRHKSQERSR